MPTQEQRTKAWARRTERRNQATGTDMGRSEEWRGLEVSESMSLSWPWPERRARR